MTSTYSTARIIDRSIDSRYVIVNQKKKKGNLNFKILKKNLFFITIFIKNFQNKIVIKINFF